MELDALKYQLQQHFKDGLCILVGSGLSCAEGLPSMAELAEKLDNDLSQSLLGDDLIYWNDTSPLIKRDGLEAALLRQSPPPGVEQRIVRVSARYIEEEESKVAAQVFNGVRQLPLSRLFKAVLMPNTGLPVITTNYDRLIEIAAEEANLGVDDMFVGRFAGRFNESDSRFSFCRSVRRVRAQVLLTYCDRISLFKPHGSLSWYQRAGRPVSYAGIIDAPRLIITPGLNKFRSGYDAPFDKHREKANSAIDKSRRLLILGYGFNDDHLETHLIDKVKQGTPTLLMTLQLSPRAEDLSKACKNVIALEKSRNTNGTTVYVNGNVHDFVGVSLWCLPNFLREVMSS